MLRPSSCIVLTTLHSNQAKVFWAMRQPEMLFLGGFHAFIGGGVERADEDWGQRHNVSLGQYVACAARELFEEVGLLCLKQGVIWSGSLTPQLKDQAWWQSLRTQSLEDSELFFSLLAQHALEIDPASYQPIGQWVTPAWAPMRFETEFFQVHLPVEVFEQLELYQLETTISVEELSEAQWIEPEQALAKFTAGDVLLTTPSVNYLQAIQQTSNLAQLNVSDQADRVDPLFHHRVMKDTYIVPMKSPTLAPATHTNCCVVGEQDFVIIDPGSKKRTELNALFVVLDALLAKGKTLKAIVLTHHHIDHVVGVVAVQQRYNLEVWCHPLTASRVSFQCDRMLEDGELIELGQTRKLRSVWTPGHAPGHLAFIDEDARWGFVGDVVASFGTILVKPPEGNMADYMASLKRIEDEQLNAMVPSHGWLIATPQRILSHYQQHRMAREQKVLDVLKSYESARAATLVPKVYDDAPPAVWPIALFSLQAHLEHLVHRGLASHVGDVFTAI